MQITIDFNALRREERRKARSHNDGNKPLNPEENCNQAPKGEKSTLSEDLHDSLSSLSVTSAPIETLLPHNLLFENVHRIPFPTIDSIYYAQNFLPKKQALEILCWLRSLPEYVDTNDCGCKSAISERERILLHNGKWTRLRHAHRKVALFDSSVVLPPILHCLSCTLVSIGVFSTSQPPNHVLINEYQPGEGILPHTDGPAYESRTATVSLGGSDVIFQFWPRLGRNAANHSSAQTADGKPSMQLILHGNGSLVVFTNDAYLNHCHGIVEGVLEETTCPGICGNDAGGGTVVKRGHRYSLTFRCKK